MLKYILKSNEILSKWLINIFHARFSQHLIPINKKQSYNKLEIEIMTEL